MKVASTVLDMDSSAPAFSLTSCWSSLRLSDSQHVSWSSKQAGSWCTRGTSCRTKVSRRRVPFDLLNEVFIVPAGVLRALASHATFASLDASEASFGSVTPDCLFSSAAGEFQPLTYGEVLNQLRACAPRTCALPIVSQGTSSPSRACSKSMKNALFSADKVLALRAMWSSCFLLPLSSVLQELSGSSHPESLEDRLLSGVSKTLYSAIFKVSGAFCMRYTPLIKPWIPLFAKWTLQMHS